VGGKGTYLVGNWLKHRGREIREKGRERGGIGLNTLSKER
jgi:hypothetical protein